MAATPALSAPFRVTQPTRPSTGVVFASPHSGRDYPTELLRRTVLDAQSIRSSEDAFVDQLLETAPGHGAALIAALAPRAWVDLNRGADELDPALIADLRMPHQNPRISAGLGVVPRVVAGGRAIYAGKIALDEAHARIDGVWRPYHARLAALMDEAHARFGMALLIDVHSMPHEALDALGPCRPEIVLGDRYGAAASSGVMQAVEAAFTAEGLRVSRNAPFAGAYIAQTYGRPSQGRHVVQVEIDRALYLDEARVRPGPGFAAFAVLMDRVVERIAAIGRADRALAAE